MDFDPLIARLRAGNTAALARAISVVENARPGFERLLAEVHHSLGRARRIGITGPPGAGKSTLVERLVAAYRQAGQRVAVVAVDPTSPFTGGALLGDRIRMESVALDDGVYIRSMGSRGSVGGLATTTREVCDLLDAANFDRILVETVGVGQIGARRGRHDRLHRPGARAGVGRRHPDAQVRHHRGCRSVRRQQGRPAGGRAVAARARGDAGAPADGAVPAPRARRSGGQADGSRWNHPVVLTVATKGEGVSELIAALDRHHDWLVESGTLRERRTRRLLDRTREVVDRATRRWVWEEARADQRIAERLEEIAAGRVSPYEVAAEVLDGLKQGERT